MRQRELYNVLLRGFVVAAVVETGECLPFILLETSLHIRIRVEDTVVLVPTFPTSLLK